MVSAYLIMDMFISKENSKTDRKLHKKETSGKENLNELLQCTLVV